MAELRIVRSSDPRLLLEAAADGFLEVAAGSTRLFPSPDYLLVLRQGGLRDDLFALAHERGAPGWFDPPICLFQQLGERLGSTGLRPCGDYERVVLLSRLLRTRAPAVFGRLSRPDAFVDAIDRLFGELVSEGVSPDSFERAIAAREDRDPFSIGRDADLAACYRAYLEALAASGRRDGRDQLVDAAAAIRSSDTAFAERLGGRREIRVLGLSDARGGWRVLLPALLDSPALDAVSLYSTAPIEDLVDESAAVVEWIGERNDFTTLLFAEDGEGPPPTASVTLLSSPDTDREAEEVARRVRKLVLDGAEPAGIAVVTRSARPYVDRVVDALGVYGVPATARQRHAFAEIPVVRAVLALFAVAAEGWTRHGLVELAEQPYFGRMTGDRSAARRLDPVIINQIGYRRRVHGLDDWIEAHRALRDAAAERELRETGGDDEPRRSRDAPPPLYRVEAALASFTGFAEQARELDRPRPLREWVGWLRHFLDEDPWRIDPQLYRVPADRLDVTRIDTAGLRGIRGIIAQWDDALAAWSEGDADIDVIAFESRLREMLTGDAALWTPVRRGVQVLEGLAAAQRSFAHVFIVGLSGDRFPLRAPRSPVFGETDRLALAAAGIPVDTRGIWEARERELFRALVAASRATLTLCWPRTDDEGRELAPSAFVEELVIAAAGRVEWPSAQNGGLIAASSVVAVDLPLVAGEEERPYAAHAAMIEQRRARGELSPWNGAIEDAELRDWLGSDRLGEDYVWSATQLEAYAKCPWAWFSQRLLRLDDLDDPDIDADPLVRGAVLHDALRRFYESARQHTGSPVFLREQDAEWAGPAVETALVDAVRSAGSRAWLGAPALHEVRIAELKRLLVRYIEWEIEYNEKHFNSRSTKRRILRTGVTAHEVAFGTMPGRDVEGEDPVMELGGARFRLRGSIDRVEVGIDDRAGDEPGRFVAAVDYKSGKYSTPGAGDKAAWDDDVVLQVPLYAHMLERLRPGTRVSRVEYRAIKQREAVHSLDLYRIERDGVRENESAGAQMELALEAAGRHVLAARAGVFPARPAPSCACPPYCHAWDICRVAGGPRTKW